MQVHVCVCIFVCVNASLPHAWKMLHAHIPISSKMQQGCWERRPLKAMAGLEQPQTVSFPLQSLSTLWPKGDNFQHPCTWHPRSASCFNYGKLMGDTTAVVGRYTQLSLCLSDLLLPDTTASCSLYFSFWLPCVLSFTLVEIIFPEIKERKITFTLGKGERQHESFSKSIFTQSSSFCQWVQ